MSVVGYSTCRIQFQPNNEDLPKHKYSDRSIIELRQHDITDYALRAIDIENHNTEIFNFHIQYRNQIQLGSISMLPDQINDVNGTYYLWLSHDSHNAFHDTCRSVLEMLFPGESTDATSENTNQSFSLSDSDESVEPDVSELIESKFFRPTEPNTPKPINCNVKDLLINIRNLGRYIKQGNDVEAARMATELAPLSIRLKGIKSKQNEEEFQIHVQLDGNQYSIDQNGGKIPVEVFSSTTIHELRAAFELAYNFPPTNQYFFVNGALVHDNSTMSDLQVGPNSLFVLFLIS